MPGWKTKRDNNSVQCSLCKVPAIYLEPIAKQKIELLMDEYPHQEWLGYLVGKVSEKKNYFVEDISIPPHKEALSASAEAEPFHIPENCIGIIHSHHGMGAFHSGTDQSYVDRNFPISITVAKKGNDLEFDAVSCALTPCGRVTTGKSSLKYVQPELLFDRKPFLEEAKKNIDMGKKVYQPPVPGVLPDPYVPVRYRLYDQEGTYWIDEHGVVLSRQGVSDVVKSLQE